MLVGGPFVDNCGCGRIMQQMDWQAQVPSVYLLWPMHLLPYNRFECVFRESSCNSATVPEVYMLQTCDPKRGISKRTAPCNFGLQEVSEFVPGK